MSRILLSILLIAIIPGLNFYLHQTLVPEQSVELALQQMNGDGSRGTLRAMGHLSNWIDVGLISVGILGLLVIWYGKIAERRRIR